MNSKQIDKAIVKVGRSNAVLSWVEIDGNWGRGYHEIAWWTKGSKSKGVTVLSTHLSRDEASNLFYMLLNKVVLINPNYDNY